MPRTKKKKHVPRDKGYARVTWNDMLLNSRNLHCCSYSFADYWSSANLLSILKLESLTFEAQWNETTSTLLAWSDRINSTVSEISRINSLLPAI